MMYNQKMAVAIKTNGKVLREFGDEVKLPFGSEFSVLVKNLNTVKALVNIFIDGSEVTGGGLVVNANCEVDLERYLSDNNDSGNKFKFIERNTAVENTRGIKVDDGIVRVEFKYALPLYQSVFNTSMLYPYISQQGVKSTSQGVWGDSTTYSTTFNAVAQNNVFRSGVTATTSDVGITVPGGISNQKFQTTSSFSTEAQSHAIILRLTGYTGEIPVTSPVTVAIKPKCITCGTVNKATAKFCSECGTSLIIV